MYLFELKKLLANYTMRKSIATPLLMILFFATISKGAEDYSYVKIAVDGMAVNNALFALSNTGKQEKAGIYHAKIDQLLDDLGTHNTGFRKDLFPVELVLKSENEAHVKMICAKLAKLLAQLNLDRISNLKSLELSENAISSLPANFNASNSLLYLSLRRNNLRELPKNLSNWTNLKYLHLGSNQFDGTERLRIQKALPTTKIIF
jgi:hypothetical protein